VSRKIFNLPGEHTGTFIALSLSIKAINARHRVTD